MKIPVFLPHIYVNIFALILFRVKIKIPWEILEELFLLEPSNPIMH